MNEIIDWLVGLMDTIGAPGAGLAIAIENLFPPIPSEAVLPLEREYRGLMSALDAGPWRRLITLVQDARFAVMTALLAGFGRAIAEVGAVLIVGGNINHATRVMTTAITLETSKGNLALALGLGIVLVTLAVSINAVVYIVRSRAERAAAL